VDVHSYVWSGNPSTRSRPRFSAITQTTLGPVDSRPVRSGHGIRDLVLAPWRLFSGGAAFECAQYLSPLPFIFAPLILFRLRGSRDRRILVAPVGIVSFLVRERARRALSRSAQPFLAALTADAMLWLAGGSRYRRRLMV